MNKKILLVIGAIGVSEYDSQYIEFRKEYNVKFIRDINQLRGLKDCDIFLDSHWYYLSSSYNNIDNYDKMKSAIQLLVAGYGCKVIGDFKYISFSSWIKLCKLRNDYLKNNKPKLLSRYQLLDFS